MHAHIHPSYVWFTAPLASGSVYHLHRAQSLVWCHRPSHHCTESPFAPLGCYPAEGRVPQPRPALPGPPCYSGLMRQTSPLSRPTHDGLVRESLQVAACPLLGRGPSRCYLLNLCGGAWTRTPPRFCGAPARFFPQNLGLTLRARGSAR